VIESEKLNYFSNWIYSWESYPCLCICRTGVCEGQCCSWHCHDVVEWG